MKANGKKQHNKFELLQQFVSADFKIRYKNSYLGLLWVILKPLTHFVITYNIFSYILKTDETYRLNLLLGLIIMLFFSELILMGLSSLVNKGYIILKINFPREVAVMSSSSIAIIDFLVNMGIFTIFAITGSVIITPSSFLLFLFSIITLIILGTGISLFTSIIFIKLRDLQNILELAIQISYWATPVYYASSMLPLSFQTLQKFNPLAIILEAARHGLIQGNLVNLESFMSLSIIFVTSLIVFLFGLRFFRKNIYKLAEFF